MCCWFKPVKSIQGRSKSIMAITYTKSGSHGIHRIEPDDVIICPDKVNGELTTTGSRDILAGDLVIIATMNKLTGEYEEILCRVVCDTQNRTFRFNKVKDGDEYENIETILSVDGAVVMGSNTNDRYGFEIDTTRSHSAYVSYEAPYWFDLDSFIVLRLGSYPHVVMKDGTVIHYRFYNDDIQFNETHGGHISTLIGVDVEFPSINDIKAIYSLNDISHESKNDEWERSNGEEEEPTSTTAHFHWRPGK